MSMLIPDLEELVPEEDHYRKLLKLVSFEQLCRPLRKGYARTGRAGYPVTSGFKCLLIQAVEDLSDRAVSSAHARLGFNLRRLIRINAPQLSLS